MHAQSIFFFCGFEPVRMTISVGVGFSPFEYWGGHVPWSHVMITGVVTHSVASLLGKAKTTAG